MSNFPYIPFYPGKWLGRTAKLSAAERGVFITLICEMYERMTPLEVDHKRLARLCATTPKTFENILNELLQDSNLLVMNDGYLHAQILQDWELQHRRDSSRPSIPTDVANKVWRRDGNQCSYCGNTEGPFHLDHIHPWSKGGSHSVDNLCVACVSCNLSKSDKTLEEWGGVQ